MKVSRREFFLGSSAAFLVSGCRTMEWLAGAPNLRFGVVSDIHITTERSTALLEKSLRYFKARGVDAVMIPGDLTDWGNKAALRYVRETWQRVFVGTEVVPLFCTGNHDYDGYLYSDVGIVMRSNGVSEADAIISDRDKRDALMKQMWQETFEEDFDIIRLRTVKGYDFISHEYQGSGKSNFAEWMNAHQTRFTGKRPFFFFQHLPIKGTTIDSNGWSDKGAVKPVLASFPNAIAFTGHTHRPFIDERQIWQGEFTAISTPSLSYSSFPHIGDNSLVKRDGSATVAMPMLPYRRDLRGGEGFVASVYDDRMVVERLDLEEDGVEGASAWVVPLDTAERPFDFKRRAALSATPIFPDGAVFETDIRNTENRQGKKTIVINCEFPAATMPDGARVHHYEIQAINKQDGMVALTKKFLSPAYAKLPKYEPRKMRFWFDVMELPHGSEFLLKVRALNSFEKCSKALASRTWKMVPEPVKAKKEKK